MKNEKLLSLKVSNRIRGILAGRGMNQTRLALAIQVPYGTLLGVVNGRREGPRVRKAMARYLGMEVEELFGEDGDGHL